MISPELAQNVVVCTPEIPTGVNVNHAADENSSEFSNTEVSDRKYIVPHPHETNSEYNLRVQWQRPGKFISAIINVFPHVFGNTGYSVGESDYEWTDCKILQKFYEGKVLWANIELRFNFVHRHINLSSILFVTCRQVIFSLCVLYVA